MGRHKSLLTATVFVSCVTACLGAGPPAPVNNPGRQLLEQTQRSAVPAPGQALAPKAQAKGIANPHEAKFLIRKIELLGVTRLSSEEQHRLISKYENRLLGVSDLNILMEAITRAYVKKGYITTRVYLPEQALWRPGAAGQFANLLPYGAFDSVLILCFGKRRQDGTL
ncbi:MAG: hypothetical protein JO170_11690 [Verrucomicrobia bacterium]|nr:hypothetical protein [Verrucomicrobiota bacterium]